MEQVTSLERRNRRDLEREKKFRKVRLVMLVIVGALAAFACVFSYYQYVNGVYEDYTVLEEFKKVDSNMVKYISYQDKILRYSNDGVSVLDSHGKPVWDGSYDMKNPTVSICGNYAAIADIGGKSIYVFNGRDSGTEIKVLDDIIQADVASQGVIAVAMEDGDSNLIDIYDPYQSGDSLRVEIPTSVDEDGFPIDIALSDDGQKLVTAFINISDGVLQNKVTFYNFDEVGQNDINRQTGMVNLEDTLLSKVDFLNNDKICIYTEKGFSLYSMKERQEKIADITFDETIKSVMSTERYVGVVLEEYSGEKKYKLIVYNLNGKNVLEKELDFDYDNIQMTDKDIIFTSDLDCNIIRLNGRKKFHKVFDQSINVILPFDDNRKYYLIGESGIQRIQLKNP